MQTLKNLLRIIALNFPVEGQLLQKKLKQLIKKITKLTKQKMRQSKLARSQDTRRKIQLGGLIIAAELDQLFDENQAILFGLLSDAKKRLAKNPALKDDWQQLGIKQFAIRKKIAENKSANTNFDDQENRK